MAVSLLRKRLLKDKMTKSFMFILTVLSLLVLVFMGVGLYMKSRMILNEHSLWDLLTNADWKPLSEEFGFLPFIIGTLEVTALSTYCIAYFFAIGNLSFRICPFLDKTGRFSCIGYFGGNSFRSIRCMGYINYRALDCR